MDYPHAKEYMVHIENLAREYVQPHYRTNILDQKRKVFRIYIDMDDLCNNSITGPLRTPTNFKNVSDIVGPINRPFIDIVALSNTALQNLKEYPNDTTFFIIIVKHNEDVCGFTSAIPVK